jgi:hypothetical protein
MGQSYSRPITVPDEFSHIHAFVTEHISPILVTDEIPWSPPEPHDAIITVTPWIYTVIFYSVSYEHWTDLSEILNLFQFIHNAYVFHYDHRRRTTRCAICGHIYRSVKFQGCETCLLKKNWPYTRYMLLREMLGRDAALFTMGIFYK